ncbi:MAG: glycosyltransferase [Hydrogenothermaceae bacterium]|nr:glycosyltransferase [Hydrogenothermaceae bacterium]
MDEITKLPLITVITVVFNGEKYLEETIQSVINQTYPNVEYIIIDGGSADKTLDLINKYERYIDYWVSEKDKGIYAWNKVLTLSFGHWLSFLGSDDYFDFNWIENLFLGIIIKI